MNLLIAIMSEAYEEVKAHAAARFCHLQLDTHSDEYARKQRLGSGTGKGYTWEFLTQWMVLIFASVFFPFLALYDLYCSCLLYTSPSPRDGLLSRMPSSA